MKSFLYFILGICLFLSTSVFAQYWPVDFSMSPIIAATNGVCNGSIRVSNNRATPHTLLWSNGATEHEIKDLCPGIYSVTVTERDGCEWILEGEVTGTGGCFLRSTQVGATVTDYCFPQLGNVKLDLPPNNRYTYSWDNGGQSSEITGLQAGTYCVTINDTEEPECMAFGCFEVIDKECNILNFGGPPLIINEFSNGPTGVEEFVEILVIGDETCDAVDIRGYILDDNDGTFSSNGVTGTGISPGHIRFSYESVWAAVPVGSLILIYDADHRNPAILLPDDPTDENNDQIYVIPSSHQSLETQTLYPNNSQPITYTIKGTPFTYRPGGDWGTMRLYEYADAIQIRRPDGLYTHGVSYGITQLMNGGPDHLLLISSNVTSRVFGFQEGDVRASKNYNIGRISNGEETPGAPNNKTNGDYIQGLCGKFFKEEFNSVESKRGSAIFYPNPFDDRVGVEIIWETKASVQFRIYDLLGKVILEQALDLVEGSNQFQVEVPDDLPSGLYQFTICKDHEILLNHKMIRANAGH